MRPRPRLAAAVSAVALLALAGCAADAEADAVQASPDTPTWDRLPDAPLSPRSNVVAAWTGEEAVFVGGETSRLCPPTANCADVPERARDGAAYDPRSRTWRTIADAPLELDGPIPPAVLDGRVFLVAEGHLLAYDPEDDTWTRHGKVRGKDQWGVLVPTGDGRLAISGIDRTKGARDRVYDPRTRTWTDLPTSPLGAGGWFTATPEGLVQVRTVTSGRGHTPDLLHAAVLDLEAMTWRRLPQSDQIGGYGWTWTGTRLVSPALGGADGGEVEPWEKWLPDGGTLEPDTGRWQRLPNAPEDYNRDGWSASAMGGRWTATGGWTYDDATESWTELPVPPGAPDEAGAAVWADGELIAFGGHTWQPGRDRPVPARPAGERTGRGDGFANVELSNGAWSYAASAAPPGG